MELLLLLLVNVYVCFLSCLVLMLVLMLVESEGEVGWPEAEVKDEGKGKISLDCDLR